MTTSNLFEDFCRFARGQIDSGDLDPMYPVLREVYRARSFDREQALWHTLLYVTWYHVGTAEQVMAAYPWPDLPPADTLRGLPTGVERRSFRGNVLARGHLAAALDRARINGGLGSWTDRTLRSGSSPEQRWDAVRAEFQSLPYGGAWSSYKWADLLAHVHGLPISASDLGVGGGSETAGPIPGMVRLTGAPWGRCARDVGLQRQLLSRAQAAGVPFTGLDQLETALCDFNSLCKGRYYVGHDIDAQQEQLQAVGASQEFWDARRATLAGQYLGEVHGWSGVRKEWRGHYARTGEVLL